MFNESTLENAIVELFRDEEHYTHKLGEQLHKNLAEVLLIEDIEAYLRAQYADITEGEIQQVILMLKAQQSQNIYDENRRVMQMIVDGFPLRRDVAYLDDGRDGVHTVSTCRTKIGNVVETRLIASLRGGKR